MEVRQATFLLALAHYGTLARAASSLHVTQSALSQALRQLESEARVKLFSRTSKGMVLTVAGENVVPVAREIVRLSNEARSVLQASIGEARGHLSLGVMPALAVNPMKDILTEYLTLYPEITVSMHHFIWDEPIESCFERKRFDLIFTHYKGKISGRFTQRIFGSQPVVVAVPKSLGLPPGPITLSQLSNIPLITTPHPSSLRDLLDAAFLTAGVEPNIRVETEFMDSLLPLAATGLGVAVLPDLFADMMPPADVNIHPLLPALKRPIGLFYPHNGASYPANLLLELVKKRLPTAT